MYKHTRVFVTLTKKVRNSVLLSAAGFVNNNLLMPTPAISKISLNAVTCNITKRYCTKAYTDYSDSDDECEENSYNPSVEVQKEIQQEAQKKLDEMLNKHPEIKKFYKVLELEIDLLQQSGGKVPSIIKPREWLQILKLKSQYRRRAYLEFLWKNEMKRQNDKLKKKEVTLLRDLTDKKISEETHLQYGLNHNTMFHRIYKATISNFYNSKLISAMMFGQKLIMDCGFESQMTSSELSSCAKQIMFGFVSNRENCDPYDFHLCNVDMKGELMSRLKSFFPTMDEPGYPLQVTPKSYLEMFSKEDLVYLTPHTNNVMNTYNPNKIYIIGAIVDKGDSKPVTLAKAKEEGIAVAKFPLDNYVDWKSGSGKILNLNHCIEIMLDIKNTNDWEYASRVVPSRKVLRDFSEYQKPRVPKTFKNIEPKFKSSHASHVPDAAYHILNKLTNKG